MIGKKSVIGILIVMCFILPAGLIESVAADNNIFISISEEEWASMGNIEYDNDTLVLTNESIPSFYVISGPINLKGKLYYEVYNSSNVYAYELVHRVDIIDESENIIIYNVSSQFKVNTLTDVYIRIKVHHKNNSIEELPSIVISSKELEPAIGDFPEFPPGGGVVIMSVTVNSDYTDQVQRRDRYKSFSDLVNSLGEEPTSSEYTEGDGYLTDLLSLYADGDLSMVDCDLDFIDQYFYWWYLYPDDDWNKDYTLTRTSHLYQHIFPWNALYDNTRTDHTYLPTDIYNLALQQLDQIDHDYDGDIWDVYLLSTLNWWKLYGPGTNGYNRVQSQDRITNFGDNLLSDSDKDKILDGNEYVQTTALGVTDGLHEKGDPMYQDVYVEIDYLDNSGCTPSTSKLDWCQDYFEDEHEVYFHYIVDDSLNVAASYDTMWTSEGNTLKGSYMDKNEDYYYYCIYGDYIEGGALGVHNGGYELFIVAAGDIDDDWHPFDTTSNYVRAVFMHELGHANNIITRTGGEEDYCDNGNCFMSMIDYLDDAATYYCDEHWNWENSGEGWICNYYNDGDAGLTTYSTYGESGGYVV